MGSVVLVVVAALIALHCFGFAQTEVNREDDIIRQLHVERMKKQILEKMGLNAPPNSITAHDDLASEIRILHEIEMHGGEESEKVDNVDQEDFYAKQDKNIVLLEQVSDCFAWSRPTAQAQPWPSQASCYTFKLPITVTTQHIRKAALWVHKLADINMNMTSERVLEDGHQISIEEMKVITHYSIDDGGEIESIRFNKIAEHNNVHTNTSAWLIFEITPTASQWLARDQQQTIRIASTSTTTNELGFSTSGDFKPLIVYYVGNSKKASRVRRSVNCVSGSSDCCRESLVINFREIGWGWVIAPESFDAFYCKGDCIGDIALANTVDSHASIMVDYIKSRGGTGSTITNNTTELIPCCTPTKMRSMSLSYFQSNGSITTFIIPNMIVEACGCK